MCKKEIPLKEFEEALQKLEFLRRHLIDIDQDISGIMQVYRGVRKWNFVLPKDVFQKEEN